jgi:hypothetical protein
MAFGRGTCRGGLAPRLRTTASRAIEIACRRSRKPGPGGARQYGKGRTERGSKFRRG